MAIYAWAMDAARPRRDAASQTGELALIEHIRRRAQSIRHGASLQLGIGDDCAVLRPRPGDEVLVTTDFSLEGRHFRRDWHSPQSIGHRALARGLSDLAAMGATPMAAFLSLALPKAVAADAEWISRFLDGLLGLAAIHRVPLAGGDTSEAPGNFILADIILLGSAPRGTALRRSTARPGDLLYCTGALGGAAAELNTAKAAAERKGHKGKTPGAQSRTEMHPHFFPAPRLAAGLALRHRSLATACIDLSDGLSTDLAHLCDASGVCAEVAAASLPLHPLAAELGSNTAIDAALNGGEDYELLFTASPETKVPRTIRSIPVTRIGRISASPRSSRSKQPQVSLIAADGLRSPLPPGGWEHLR